MGLNKVVRSAVAIANKVTGGATGLQDTVSHYAATGAYDNHGIPAVSPTPVSRLAIIDRTTKKIKDMSGEEKLITATITFLYPVTITIFDKFVLPDGKTGPIVNMLNGLYDPTTHSGYYAQVFLG